MGYTEFETANAKYRFELRTHTVLRPKDFKGARADAFVLEYADNPKSLAWLKWNLEWSTISKHASKNQIPIWLPDVGPKPARLVSPFLKQAVINTPSVLLAFKAFGDIKELRKERPDRRSLIKQALKVSAELAAATVLTPFSWMGIIGSPGKIKKREPFRKAFQEFNKLWPNAAEAGRDAICAEKIDGFIAPRLRQQLGRKPVIYIKFGPFHVGLQRLLLEPKARQEVLKAFSPPSAFFRSTNLHSCVEYEFDPKAKKWRMTEHKETIRFPGLSPRRQKLKSRSRAKPGAKMSRRQFLRKTLRV